jgi:Protein of unknown function (DUF2878)
MATLAARPGAGARRLDAAPTRLVQIANFILFQAAWFAGVLGAAHGLPLYGTTCLIAAIAWHLAVSARPLQEARLAASLALLGLVAESVIVMQGHVRYPSGQPVAWLAPYWIVAMWAELAMALNVTLRWLKRRPGLAAVLGAIGGPASFAGGAKLGGAEFIDRVPALVTLACAWAVLMPLVMWLSDRFDGVAVAGQRAEPVDG